MFTYLQFLFLTTWILIASGELMRSQVVSRMEDANGMMNRCSYSSEEISGSLDLRSSNADVVLTGTILKLMPEATRRGIEHMSYRSYHSKSTGRTLTGHVKVWSVMKGSISDISDKRRKYKKRKRDTDTLKKNNRTLHLSAADMSLASQESPVVELHGLWNSHLCDSFLGEGDTRVFFLRKMEDHRPKRVRRKRSARVQKRERKNRRRKRGKGRKNKKRNKKRNSSKSSKRRQKSESFAAKLRKLLKRPKDEKTREKKEKSKQRSTPDTKFSVLLVNSEPAKITLKNLKTVETLNYSK